MTLERELAARIDRVTDLKLKEQAARLAARQFDRQAEERAPTLQALNSRVERSLSALRCNRKSRGWPNRSRRWGGESGALES